MLDRREFLGTMGGGVLVLVAAGVADAQRGEAAPQEISAWLHIGKDGMVTACTGKVEAGQGYRLRWRRQWRRSCERRWPRSGS